MNPICIRGAKLHNLKSLSLDIPKGKFVVITGVSGSGKSTLAFDLLYQEGRRRYDRAVGSSHLSETDCFDEITGLVPTVAVEQRIIRQSNPRSLVGTRTRLLSLMQIVFSMAGSYRCICGGETDEQRLCHDCGLTVEPLPAEHFNFNSPFGMCLRCFGAGQVSSLTIEQAMSDRNFDKWSVLRGTPGKMKDGVKRLAKAYDFDPNGSYFNLSDKAQVAYLNGDLSVGYEGLMPFLHRISIGAEGTGSSVCPSCHGSRIGREAQNVTIRGLHISALAEKTLKEQAYFWDDISESILDLEPSLQGVLKRIQMQINHLCGVGLSHLSLYRRMPTLSGGEMQRLFLAAHLESELEGLIYVFDEPTVGLHENEKQLLIKRLKELQTQGNSVIVVEHDLGVISSADWIIEIGPGAGEEGGSIVYQGNYKSYMNCVDSLIAPFLSRADKVTREGFHRARQAFSFTDAVPRLKLKHATTNNLKDIDVSIPLGIMVGVAGVSGSGKSSLISSTLVPLLAKSYGSVIADVDQEIDAEDEQVITIESKSTVLEGSSLLNGVSFITQSSIGRSKTSTPASYIGIWEKIRTLFANQNKAKGLGLTSGDFSFNSTGACSECRGEGTIKKETRGFTFEWPCHACNGTRYCPEVLDITVNGKNIADTLKMSVTEAADFFGNESGISEPLRLLEKVGMGYLKLGQSSTTISGGEAQRIKLAKELGRSRTGGILYIFDEPTTGLSCVDVERLMEVLRSLVDLGNTVLVVEHDLSVLLECDWLIEMGPGGGNAGGLVIAEGSPETLALLPNSIIGSYFRGGSINVVDDLDS
ncbi:excinuclease ABC subunit A [Paenibacillus baekrokdamisoli]|uniref:UvrABC system protein A n=1 Tax=Paenibacillus baekrokdamisoli TaxID=1712516 RepID=A0A3G9IPS8_9BACL|nr:ATP-binding cassette domain-containing protein [Paenibacillus baekrokdamisoli]MBB3071966.1 excinuclease UvrABC ATPase subunit [Paenibacillus baekrokdamisoli]BBH20272.1 excinuclease ABC subunit A [Paenibacillus baekrokdamisoli]